MTLLLAVLFSLPAVLPASALPAADPGQRTFWDQMMEAQSERMLYQGAVYMGQKRYADAVKEFVKAVVAAPEDATPHRMLGVAYYWSGQVDRAETEFMESLRLDPKSAQTHLLIGIVHAWRGNAEKAYASFQEAARLEPGRADIQMNLGSIEESLGKIPQALDHFRKAVELDREYPLYHFQLGMLYRRLGRDEEAVAELRTALRKYPYYQDALLELGAAYERMGRADDAADMFQKAVRLKEKDSVARLRLARALLSSGKEKRAREVLREVFHLTPADKGQGLALSVSYGGQPASGGGGGQGASPAGGTPSDGPQGPLGVLARNLERIPLEQEAVLQVDIAFLPRPKLVRRSDATGEGKSSLKNALERAGKPPSQVMAARREYSFKAADQAGREEEVRRALEDLKSVLDTAPEGAETRFGMNLAFSDRPSSSRGSGSEEGKPGVSFNPHDVGNDLGLWVIGTGWMSLVEEVLSHPGEPVARPDTAPWWVVEGVGFATLGDGRRSMEAFNRALELDPGDELAHLGRGVSPVIRGDEAGALAEYRRALAINPKNKTAAEGIKWLQRSPASAARKGP